MSTEQGAGYPNQELYPPPQAYPVAEPPQGGYPPQRYPVQYPVQQGYGPPGYGPYPVQLGYDEYVDRYGRVRKKNAGKLAALLVLCWCITWPCHGPCCGGL